MKKRIIAEWFQIASGLAVFAFGVHLTIFANIGLAPWDCLGMGIAKNTFLNYGLAMTATSVVILFIDYLLNEPLGYGTIIDALITNNLVQLYNDINPLPENNDTFFGIVLMVIGFFFMAIGMWIYMKAAQGCGPRDSLLVGLGKLMPKMPIGVVEILLWAAVLVIGWLLGGPVGIGTLIATFGAGAVMQIEYTLLRFDPRDIKHRNVTEITAALKRRN